MKISVITVCRNSEATIAHTIESFLEQTHANKEMVVVDGSSSDRRGKAFSVLGRIPKSELRGCSDTHAVEGAA